MGEVEITFKHFFKSTFDAERTYVQFNPHHFEKFYEEKMYEMANPGVGSDMGDIIKAPIPVGDRDDMNFLQQFPSEYWRLALHQRYEKLKQAIVDLHKKREKLGLQDLHHKIRDVMTQAAQGDDSGWATLSGDLPPAVINRLQRRFTPDYLHGLVQELPPDRRQEGIDKIIDDHAHQEAFEEIKSQTEEIPNDTEDTFTFGKKKIIAKPYLGRLYHKIERTQGQPHHRHSGLHDLEDDPSKDIHGQLGYDLSFPNEEEVTTKNGKKIKKFMTRGLGSWPDPGTSDALSHYLTLNQHNMFGDLKYPSDATWKQVRNRPPLTANSRSKNPEGSGVLKDSWVLNRLRRDYEKKFEAEIRRDVTRTSDGELLYRKENDVLKEARKRAKLAVLKDIVACQKGDATACSKVSAPPVPGQPGIPRNFKIPEKDFDPRFPDEMNDVEQENYLSKFIDKGGGFTNIEAPDVYLPHVKKTIKNADGSTETIDVPYTNPSHYFRELGTEDSDYDYEIDPQTGQYVLGANGHPKKTGKYKTDHLQGKLVGGLDAEGNPRYVRVDQNEYDKTRQHQAPTSYQPNHNSQGRYFISRADSRYEEAYAKVFDDTTKKDFRAGVIECVFGACGGSGQWEKTLLRQNLEAIIELAIRHAKNNLGDPQLYTPKGRKAFARGISTSYLQLDLGRGSRRNRDYGRRAPSMNQTTTGSEGGEVGIGDSIQASGKKGPAQNYANDEGGKGSRPFTPFGGDSWLVSGHSTYSAQGMRETLQTLKAEAQEADRRQQIAMRDPGIGKQDILNLVQSTQDRNEILEKIKGYLLALNGADIKRIEELKAKEKPTPAEKQELSSSQNIEALVNDTIKGWIADGADTSEKIFARFENDPKVIERSGGKVGAVTNAIDLNNDDAKQIIDKFVNSSHSDPSKDVLNNVLDAQENPQRWAQVKPLVVTQDGSPGRVVDSYFADPDTAADWGWSHKSADERQRIMQIIQAYLNKEFGSADTEEEEPQAQTQPMPNPQQTPSQAPLKAARAVAGVAPASPVVGKGPPGAERNPANDNKKIYQLLGEKKYHDAIMHPDFGRIVKQLAIKNPKAIPYLKSLPDEWVKAGWPAKNFVQARKILARI